jgi:spermidine/putrescine-binding protein
VERFERLAGVRLVEDVFLAEAEMLARTRAGGQYDVAATIDYLLSTLQREGLLRELPATLEGVEHLDAEHPPWVARADRGGGTFAVPYLWGTTGIGYDADRIEAVDSWSALFDERWAGRVSVLDSKGDVFDQALLAAGMDINSTDKPRLREEILPMLIRQKQLLRGYDADPARALVSGETWIAQIDSGDLLRARRLKPSLRYVIPKEGAARWTDYLVVPAATRDFELAKRFLSFTLDPANAALNANELCFATPNRTALEQGLVENADDPMIYPPAEVRARLFESENWAGNTGRVVDELWLELRAAG